MTEKDHLLNRPTNYGISYYGDISFIKMIMEAAVQKNLLKPFNALTIRDLYKLDV